MRIISEVLNYLYRCSFISVNYHELVVIKAIRFEKQKSEELQFWGVAVAVKALKCG